MKRKGQLFFKFIIGILLLTILIPILCLIFFSFTERWAWPDIVPQVISMRALREIWARGRETMWLFISSIMISLVVALLSVLIALMTARAMVFYEWKGKNWLYLLSILPFMVPATVFAMGIQRTFIKMGLSNTVFGVIIAHLICSLPYATRLLMDGTEAVGTGLEEQARVLGASSFQAFRKVTLPMLVPVMLSAFSMSYIVSFSQYFLTLLIGGGSVKTFTIVMVPYLQGGDRNIASTYSTVFLAITLIVFEVFEMISIKISKNNRTEYYS